MGLNLLPVVLVVVGAGLLVVGAWWVSPPVALVFAGAALVSLGMLLDVGDRS